MNGPVFLLGAGGFIGRHLANALASDGCDVIAATRRPVAFEHPGIRNVVAAWDHRAAFAEWLAQCDAVVHAASSSTPGSSAAQPQLEGNLRTTLAMIEALQELPSRRLLFLSSGGTLYGNCASPAREDAPLRPRSYHGAGKIAAECFIRAWAAQYPGTAIILRPSNVYGPGQRPGNDFGVIPTAFGCALEGSPFSILGDGRALRDYLYIDDFIALCRAVLSAELDAGARVYNAASGQAVELLALLDRIDGVTGKPMQRVFRPARPVDVRTITLDNSAAKAAFGWDPVMDLDQGLRRSWNWFRETA